MKLFSRFFTGLICLTALLLCFSAKAQEAPVSSISKYDTAIRAEAGKIGWDWRLLASIIYHESNFKADLVNKKGAFGLMQFMPVTMKKYGIDHNSTVEEQLAAGCKLLVYLDRNLPESIVDSLERRNFILACYNGGIGHVLKARTKAEKDGRDPDVWTGNVEQHAHKQTRLFVKKVNERYNHYKTIIE